MPTLRSARHLRTGLSLVAVGSVAVLGVACGSKEAPQVSATASLPSQGQITVPSIVIPSVTVPTTPALPTTVTTEKKSGSDTTAPKTSTTKKAPPTTVAKKSGGEFVIQAVDAYKEKLGAEFKAMDITVWVQDNERAEANVQDPAKPANVDNYEFDGSKVGSPNPVKLSGDGDLESNLFMVTEVAWEKMPELFEIAKTEIGSLEGSTGVTHVIIQKNLPFDSDTVIRVYVDGGTRSGGGSVAFHADGSVKQVYAPS